MNHSTKKNTPKGVNDYKLTYLAWVIPLAIICGLYALSYLLLNYFFEGRPAFSGLYTLIALMLVFATLAVTIPSIAVYYYLKRSKLEAAKITAILLPLVLIVNLLPGNVAKSINDTYQIGLSRVVVIIIEACTLLAIPLYTRFLAKKLVSKFGH